LSDEFAVDKMRATNSEALAPAIDRTDGFYRVGLAEGYAAGLREGIVP
jgi:hypothetical protein